MLASAMISNTTGSDSRRQSRIFYGWWIVAVSSILGMFGNGSISSGFPRFFEPIRQDLGISSTQMGLVFGLARAEGGMGGPLVGWLTDKFGARPMVFFGGLIAGIGLMLLSRAHSYWELVFLFAGVVSVGKTAALGQTLMAAVNQWFIRRKALALSTLMTAFAAGGAFVVLLLDLGISHLGRRLCRGLLPTARFQFSRGGGSTPGPSQGPSQGQSPGTSSGAATSSKRTAFPARETTGKGYRSEAGGSE